ncbi:MAG: hypothetical protein LBS84_11345 [Clostridiales bacterium]|jgi:hypothetical protein|nr:hypothetical protein [Clostridiales bacterium]
MYFAKAIDTRNASVDYTSEIGATKENTSYEGYTPFNPTGPATIFDAFEGGDINKPKNPDLKYIILSSSMYDRFYAEPDEYGGQIAFYDAVKANMPVIKEFKPAAAPENAIDFVNIGNSLTEIIRFINGGYSGPHLIFYQYSY